MGHRRALLTFPGEFVKLASPRPGDTVEIVSNDVPADAVVVNANYDWVRDCIILTLESPSFAEVPEGKRLPFLRGPQFVVRAGVAPEPSGPKFRQFF